MAVALATAAVLALALWTGSRWEARGEPLAASPSKVVLFGIPQLGFEDLGAGATPALDRLVRRGAIGAMTVGAYSARPSSAEAYATLGAGVRLRAAAEDGVALPWTGEGLLATGGPAVVAANAGRHLSSRPGALGEALARAGHRTAVVSNGDFVDPETLALRSSRPAALALMDERYALDAGAVGRGELLEREPGAPSGYRADPLGLRAAVGRALARADVVLVDPGDLDRAIAFRAQTDDADAARAARELALRRTDTLLGALARELPDDVLLLVVSVRPPRDGWLTPALVVGRGVKRGYLVSPSTKRRGVLAVTDLAPTVLDALGAQVPSGMVGHPLRYQRATPDLAMLRALDRDTRFQTALYHPALVGFIVFQAILYGVLLALLLRRRERPLPTWARPAALTVASFPLATFLLRAIPGVQALDGAALALLAALAAGCAALSLRARAHPLQPLAAVLGATIAVLLADVATGGQLHVASLLGYSLRSGGRFYGYPNTTFAVIAACALLLAAIHVHYARDRRAATIRAAALMLLVVVVDGAPTLGSDAGGIVTLVPVFGLTAIALTGRRLSARTLAPVALATVVLLAAAIGLDLLRPAGDRTHLGRFAAEVADNGFDQVATTIARKQSANVRILQASVWTWLLPVLVAYIAGVLILLGGWRRLLPPGSTLRAGFLGLLALAVLGFLLNDSGPVVIALALLYAGPFLTLLLVAQTPTARQEPGSRAHQ